MKKYLKVVILLLVVCLLAGCGYSKEEKEHMKKIQEQGEKNVISYIEKKYNFTPEVVSVVVEKKEVDAVPDFFPPPTGSVNVKLKYKDKEFNAYISGEEETLDGKDNYQYNDIKDGFSSFLISRIPYSIRNVHLFYGDNRMISEYYDGSNLDEIMKLPGFNAVVEYVDISDFSGLYTSLDTEYPNVLFKFLNFKSEEDYLAFDKNIKYNNTGIDDSYLYSFAIYLKDIWKICGRNNMKKYIQIPIEEKSELFLYYTKGSNDEIINTSFDEVNDFDLENFNALNEYSNYKFISKTYAIKDLDESYRKIYVYTPKSDNHESKKTEIGIECHSKYSSDYNYSTDNVVDIGNYYVGEVSLLGCDLDYDVKVAVLYNSRS